MFLVQIEARQTRRSRRSSDLAVNRFSGFGETIEKATRDLIKHFNPGSVAINDKTVRVFCKCSETGRFIPLPETDAASALEVVSNIVGASTPDK